MKGFLIFSEGNWWIASSEEFDNSSSKNWFFHKTHGPVWIDYIIGESCLCNKLQLDFLKGSLQKIHTNYPNFSKLSKEDLDKIGWLDFNSLSKEWIEFWEWNKHFKDISIDINSLAQDCYIMGLKTAQNKLIPQNSVWEILLEKEEDQWFVTKIL
jgi:hypothetical protein